MSRQVATRVSISLGKSSKDIVGLDKGIVLNDAGSGDLYGDERLPLS